MIRAQVVGSGSYATEMGDAILVCICDSPIAAALVTADFHSKAADRTAMVLDPHSKVRPNLNDGINHGTSPTAGGYRDHCQYQFW